MHTVPSRRVDPTPSGSSAMEIGINNKLFMWVRAFVFRWFQELFINFWSSFRRQSPIYGKLLKSFSWIEKCILLYMVHPQLCRLRVLSLFWRWMSRELKKKNRGLQWKSESAICRICGYDEHSCFADSKNLDANFILKVDFGVSHQFMGSFRTFWLH